MNRQTIIGITGGTGCGKTTALTALSELGVHIIDCDAVYHTLLETDKESAAHCTASAVLRAEVNWAANTGLGCGGDPKKAERAFSRKRNEITQALAGQDFIIVTGGLGGGNSRTEQDLSMKIVLLAIGCAAALCGGLRALGKTAAVCSPSAAGPWARPRWVK